MKNFIVCIISAFLFLTSTSSVCAQGYDFQNMRFSTPKSRHSDSETSPFQDPFNLATNSLQFQKLKIFSLFSFYPVVITFAYWYFFKRDVEFVSDNIYNNDSAQPTRFVPIFKKHPTPNVYQPIKGITPSQVGLVIDEQVHTQDIVAEILELSRRKYLKITKEKRKFLHNPDFVFEKLKEADDKLELHQQALLKKLFVLGSPTKLSQLKGNFFNQMDQIKEIVSYTVYKKGIFTNNPSKSKIQFFILGFILLLSSAFAFTFYINNLIFNTIGSGMYKIIFYMVGIIFVSQVALFNYQHEWFQKIKPLLTQLFSVLLISAPLIILFYVKPADLYFVVMFTICVVQSTLIAIMVNFSPQKTALGTNIYRQATGLRQTFKTSQWRLKYNEDKQIIDEILPFAVALGVVTKYSKALMSLGSEKKRDRKLQKIIDRFAAKDQNTFDQLMGRKSSRGFSTPWRY